MTGRRKLKGKMPSMEGGNVKNWLCAGRVSVMAIVCAGMLAGGCKSAPDLSQANAKSLIEANYAHAAPAPATIVVNDLGMREGVTAKYWEGSRRYPNGYWADFKLTPDGMKLVKLGSVGDTIAWRPNGPSDPHYSITVTTVAAVPLKAEGIGDVEDNGAGKLVSFTEVEDLSGLPDALKGIAQNPGNSLSTQRQASFVLANGAWTLESVQ
jgi:hypothetical protein